MSAFTLLAGVLTHSVLLSGALRGDSPGLDLHIGSAGKPPLCDPEVVKATCASFDRIDGISPAEVQAAFTASSESIDALWGELGLLAEGATCAELCAATVESLAKTTVLPPSSDVGCHYSTIAGESKVTCDIDLDPVLVSKESAFESDLPDFHDKEIKEKVGRLLQPRMRDSGRHADELIDFSLPAILRRVANLFRIYPVDEMHVTADTPRSKVRGGSAELTADVKAQLETVNMKARVYVQTAIMKFRARQTRTSIEKWFGPDAYTDTGVRDQVQLYLNSIDAMLDKVEYVYPGEACDSSTYAYVYPEAYTCDHSKLYDDPCTRTEDGKFVMYVCPLTLRRPLAEQIEMMTHEGSHHATAYTDDVEFDGTSAYGRKICARLAREDPSEALRNADNLCYYIQDVGHPSEGASDVGHPSEGASDVGHPSEGASVFAGFAPHVADAVARPAAVPAAAAPACRTWCKEHLCTGAAAWCGGCPFC